jgi:hypothetical protein
VREVPQLSQRLEACLCHEPGPKAQAGQPAQWTQQRGHLSPHTHALAVQDDGEIRPVLTALPDLFNQ